MRNSSHRVALLLTANMYFALLFSGISSLELFVHVLPGHLYLLSSLNDGISCPMRAYFQWVSVCVVCYSNTLQAIYRLCRVIFHRQKSLQSIQLYKILIIIQWIICLLFMIPSFVLGDYKYSIDDYYCQNDISNLRSSYLNSALAYSIPVSVTIGCYIYTLIKIRRRNNSLIQTMTQIQLISVRRDLVVLFRICLLLGIIMIVAIPVVIAFCIYIFTGYKPWWTSQIQRLVFNLSAASVTVILALMSPHVCNLWRRNHHQTVISPAIIQIK